jgi:hypothetical protein
VGWLLPILLPANISMLHQVQGSSPGGIEISKSFNETSLEPLNSLFLLVGFQVLIAIRRIEG